MSHHILLVEDDHAIATVIENALDEEGYKVTICSSIAQRNALLADYRFDVMLTDVMLEDGDGLAMIEGAQKAAPDMPIIVLSAQNTLDTAVRASDSHVFEYFPKPFDLDDLSQAVRQAVKQSPQRNHSQDEGENEGELPLIGRSQAMQDVYRMITRVLRNTLSVLITGESGTGKELVAEAIHQLGMRQTGPFVAVNMAAIPHDLLESELFGHERGAFTGAVAQQIGKFEQANGGTLFLDEIGDMPIEAQTRLLRALQSGKIRRVGGRQEIGVDVRVVAATNRDLIEMVAQGRFREDLLYRLNVVPIHIPPLRERREDIDELARHFLGQAIGEGLPSCQITERGIAALKEHQWRGNVRELRNVIFRLSLMSRDGTIDAEVVENALQPEIQKGTGERQAGFKPALAQWLSYNHVSKGALYHEALAAFEKPLFEHALCETEGNQLRAAQLLGINRNTLRKRLSDLAIDPDIFVRRR